MAKKFVVVDIETTGLDTFKDELHGVAHVARGECLSPPCYTPAGKLKGSEIVDLLSDPRVDKVGHNIRQFDARFLERKGITVAGKLWDTKDLARRYRPNWETGLKSLTARLFGTEKLVSKSELDLECHRAGVDHVGELCAIDLNRPDEPYFELISRYAKEDVVNTWNLFLELGKRMRTFNEKVKGLGFEKGPLDYYLEEDQPLYPVLMSMELSGIKLNPDAVKRRKKEFEAKHLEFATKLNTKFASEIARVEQQLAAKVKASYKKEASWLACEARRPTEGPKRLVFSWNADAAKVLYRGLEEKKVPRSKQGRPLTSKVELQGVARKLPDEHPFNQTLPLVLGYRKYEKLVSTYSGRSGKGLLSGAVNGRIYPNYNLYPNTGRLSSSSPNMQNLAPEVSAFFTPDEREEVVVYIDYSQVELRIAAHLSQDPRMLETFQLELDPHAVTAGNIFGKKSEDVTKIQRQVGKRVNFLLIYRGSPYRLFMAFQEDGLNQFSLEDCKKFSSEYFKIYPRYLAYLNEQLAFFKRYRCAVAPNGLVKPLPHIILGERINHRARTVTLERELAKVVREAWIPNYVDDTLYARARYLYGNAERMGYNLGPQSVGGTATKKALVAVHKAGYRVMNTIHDSLAIALKKSRLKELPFILRIIETAYQISVPLKAEAKILNSLDETDLYLTSEPAIISKKENK